jgi:hypothetical protein
MHVCIHEQLLHASSLACQPTYIIEMNYSTKLAVLVLAILLLIIGPAGKLVSEQGFQSSS